MQIPENTSLNITTLLMGDIQLATPPHIYISLKAILDNPNKSPKDAAFIIEKDVALSARLLKIVNSAYYGFPSQIVSIDKAISLIGTRELQNLVLSTIIIERFSDLPGQTFSIHDFWAKNLRCALLARQFDRELGNRNTDSSFICGLLHNIGLLLFYLRIPALARDIDLLLQSKQPATYSDQIFFENQIIGFDHFQAGAELCRLWQLPEIIIETIRLHAFADANGEFADLATIVRVADLFSSVDAPFDETIANSLNLSPDQISQNLDKVHDEFEAIFKLFYGGK